LHEVGKQCATWKKIANFSNLTDETGGNFAKSAAFFIQTCPPGR
jgi:hypothetical protein